MIFEAALVLLLWVGFGVLVLLSRSFMIRSLDAIGLVRNPRHAWIAMTILGWFTIVFGVGLVLVGLLSGLGGDPG